VYGALNVPTLGNKHSQNTVVADCIIIFVSSTELSPEVSFVPYLALHYHPAEKDIRLDHAEDGSETSPVRMPTQLQNNAGL